MPDEPDKPGGTEPEVDGSAEETAENERPTVSPPFDPIAFAKEILRPSPAAGIPIPPLPKREREDEEDLHTHATPPQGTEQQAAAAQASRISDTPRRKTPTSTLSLANARIPSNLPPRIRVPSAAATSAASPPPPQKLDSLSSMNAVDREWADLELSTRPPPPDSPYEDPVIEIVQDRPSQLDLDDVDLDTHGADTVRRPIPGIAEADFREVLPPDEIPPSSIPGGPRSSNVAVPPREREMNDRVSLGDYSGALEIAERILEDEPENAAATACADNCRTVLRQMYAARIGPLDRVPIVMVARDQLRWLSIDHKAGFVLSLVDGVSSLEMIIDVSGMPELDTLRILSELAQQRIISLR